MELLPTMSPLFLLLLLPTVFSARASCNYQTTQRELPPPDAAENTTVSCYTADTPSTAYDVLGKSTVETRRACEVLCDKYEKCVAFSFEDLGLESSCVLLTIPTACATEVFTKRTTGCTARTNITADFGVDPCIDTILPFKPRIGSYHICPQAKEKDEQPVLRAVLVNGTRITLDNDINNVLTYDTKDDYWVYTFNRNGRTTRIPIVAAACTLAGGDKCPCSPLQQFPNTFPAKVDTIPPCGSNMLLKTDVAKMSGLNYTWNLADSAQALVTCKAGMWYAWLESTYTTFGVSAVGCVKH